MKRKYVVALRIGDWNSVKARYENPKVIEAKSAGASCEIYDGQHKSKGRQSWCFSCVIAVVKDNSVTVPLSHFLRLLGG